MRPLLVVGSINLDVSLRVPRLTIAGETLVGRDLQLSPGGKGANQAHAARLDGAVVRLVGAVGRDGFAQQALGGLQACGVDLRAVQHLPDAATGVAVVQVTDDGDNAIALAPGANEGLGPDDLDRVVDAATWASHDLLLQWELAPETAMRAALRARAAGRRVILNLAPARLLSQLDLALVDWCVLNSGELQALAEHLHLGLDGPAAAQALAQRVGAGVVLTVGAQGLFACTRSAVGPGEGHARSGADPGHRLPPQGLHLPAYPVSVVDSTGAGDTLCGVFAAALAAGLPAAHALQRANAAAALACMQRGAQAAQPSSSAINALLARGTGAP